ncbi:MAG: DUF4832 domain-containing protein, partial [Thermoguttaceae bacterium]
PNHWFHSNMAEMFWHNFPVILEHEHFGSSKAIDAWQDGSLLLQSVEEYHASYMSIHWWPQEFYKENREIIEKINQRLGYRIQLRELITPKSAIIGEPFSIKTTWANVGVAPCYGGGYPTLTLKDEEGGIVSVLVDDAFNVKTLPIAPPEKSAESISTQTFRIGHVGPTTKPGSYHIFVSIGRRDGTPEIALPLPDEDGQRRYKIGTIELKNKQ